MLNAQMFIKRYVLYVRLDGELDQYTVENLRIKVSELIDKYRIRFLVLNFERLDFMDSSGIGFIIGRYHKLRKANGGIILCSVNEHIKRIVMLSGLIKMCVIKKDEEEVNNYLGVLNEEVC